MDLFITQLNNYEHFTKKGIFLTFEVIRVSTDKKMNKYDLKFFY